MPAEVRVLEQTLGDGFCSDHLPPRGDDQPFELSQQAARIPVGGDQDAVGRQLREGFDPVVLDELDTPRARALGEAPRHTRRLHGRVGGSEDPCEKASAQRLTKRLSPLGFEAVLA